MKTPVEDPTKEFQSTETLEPICVLEKLINIPFPKSAFPARIREICDHLHELNGTPLEMLYFCAAGIVAGIAGDRFQAVGAIRHYKQIPNQYFVGIGESSSGKSTALEPLLRAVKRYEAELYNSYKSNTNPNSTDPRFIVENASSESLSVKMEKTGSPIFSLSPEARQVFEIIGGTYKKSGGDGVSFYNQAWSGESYSCDRITRNSIYISKAVLSSLWLIQPDVIVTLTQQKTFKDSGLMARLMAFKSNAPLQYDTGNTPKEDERLFYNWESFLIDLLENRSGNIKTIQANDTARNLLRAFFNRYIDFQNTLKTYADLIAKSAEKAARLALLFAICDENDEIDGDTARNACAVVDYCNGVLLDIYTVGYKARSEENRKRIEAFFKERNTTRLTSAQFRQYKRIELVELEQAAQEYPSLFNIGNGRQHGSKIINYISI